MREYVNQFEGERREIHAVLDGSLVIGDRWAKCALSSVSWRRMHKRMTMKRIKESPSEQRILCSLKKRREEQSRAFSLIMGKKWKLLDLFFFGSKEDLGTYLGL